MEIKRDQYLQQILDFMWDGQVKVITGIRRCGKSYLMRILFKNYLLTHGVKEEHILSFFLRRSPETLNLKTFALAVAFEPFAVLVIWSFDNLGVRVVSISVINVEIRFFLLLSDPVQKGFDEIGVDSVVAVDKCYPERIANGKPRVACRRRPPVAFVDDFYPRIEPGEFVAYFAAVVRRPVVDEYNFHFAIRLVCQTVDALAQHVAWDFVYGNDKTKIGHIASLFRLESGFAR